MSLSFAAVIVRGLITVRSRVSKNRVKRGTRSDIAARSDLNTGQGVPVDLGVVVALGPDLTMIQSSDFE